VAAGIAGLLEVRAEGVAAGPVAVVHPRVQQRDPPVPRAEGEEEQEGQEPGAGVPGHRGRR
jgi:hypothetical protein